jgi:hypothetical protein
MATFMRRSMLGGKSSPDGVHVGSSVTSAMWSAARTQLLHMGSAGTGIAVMLFLALSITLSSCRPAAFFVLNQTIQPTPECPSPVRPNGSVGPS